MPLPCFADLVEPDHLRQLLATHFAGTGMPTGLMDASGRLLINIGLHDACHILHNGEVASCQECHQGTPEARASLRAGIPCEYRCKHGLCDYGIPIIVEGSLLATILLGQFYYENDDPLRDVVLLEAAGKTNLTKAVFFQAMRKIPRFPHSEVESIRRHGMALAVLLADLAAKNLRLMEALAQSAIFTASQGNSERYFQEALQSSQKHVIYRRNVRSGGYDYISPAVAEMLGVSQAKMLADGQRTIWEAMHPEDRGRVQKKVARAYREQRPRLSIEFRIFDKDGNCRWFRDTATIIYNAKGEPEAHVGVGQDITHRQRLETELAETKAVLEAAFAENPAGMLLIDVREHRVLMINDAFRQLAGLGLLEAVADGLDCDGFYTRWQVFQPDGTPVPREERPIFRALRNQATAQEYRIRRADGTEVWVQARGTPIHGQDDGVIAGLLIVEDITVRKREEAERQRQAEKMVQSQKMESLGFLAGGIAHDFNNLLMTIFGNLELVTSEIPSGSPLHANLRDMHKASRRAADLCNQMLAYSGKGKYMVQPLNLNKVVLEMRGMMEAAAAQKAVLHYSLADDLPSVNADIPQMQQTIMNLILNAVEAIPAVHPKGTVTIRTSTVRLAPAAFAGFQIADTAVPGVAYVCLEVADNGCGMDKKTMARMFDPFFSTKFTGRGLGLAAAQGIVRSHNGAIHVTSEPGRGSTFQLFFPAGAGETVADREAPAKSWKKWQGTGTILLVDDEAAVRTTTTRMLEMLGLRVIACDNGKQAVKALADAVKQKELPPEERIVCVILDLGLSGLDETQTLAELRRLSPGLHVLVASGYNREVALARFKGEELSGTLQKPYGLNSLADKLRQTLG